MYQRTRGRRDFSFGVDWGRYSKSLRNKQRKRVENYAAEHSAFQDIDPKLLYECIQNNDVQGVLSMISWYFVSMDDVWETYGLDEDHLIWETKSALAWHYYSIRYMIIGLLRCSGNARMQYVRQLFKMGSYNALRSMLYTQTEVSDY